MKVLGCLHAHYSNIRYIEEALSGMNVELQHFVDPGLINRINHDHTFSIAEAKRKVIEQVQWIENSGVDAILITCTNYIALLDENYQSMKPIIKLDEPFFQEICDLSKPLKIVFTNPATVEGTINRLNQFANKDSKSLDIEVHIIEGAFKLVMEGQLEGHNRIVAKELEMLVKDSTQAIVVAQLSMVDASKQINSDILNPLQTLVPAIQKTL
ncbi:hypothetical protein [Viridibacillus arvi]|uniref:hypothetical protein n=1 Tax=Viridibacillus arvi TaxID=263475 RepID=UPI00187B176A|nr:hypothetical protein [Viridibacillus sp. JNUCC-6]QOV13092.1 hypothetical protein JNUCC6_10205 [Viridibacillus sp. JNUCC-6]